MRLIVLVAVAAAVTAGSVSAASTVSRTCGTVNGGGATWSVVAAGVSCGAAKPLVKKLAAKPHSYPATRLGTYLGLKCVEFAARAKGGKREIACVSASAGKSVFGVTSPGK
jgi:hypothetical protein